MRSPERERERKNKKEKQRDTFREREPSSLIGLIVVLSFDFKRAREDDSLSLSLLAHMASSIVTIPSSDTLSSSFVCVSRQPAKETERDRDREKGICGDEIGIEFLLPKEKRS